MNIETILDDFKEKLHFRREGDEVYLLMPFFRYRQFESVELKLFREGDSWFVTDCGGTARYLADRLIELDACRGSLERIKKRYRLTERAGYEFVMEYPSESASSVEMFTGYFLQAISYIANLDLTQ